LLTGLESRELGRWKYWPKPRGYGDQNDDEKYVNRSWEMLTQRKGFSLASSDRCFQSQLASLGVRFALVPLTVAS